VAIDGLAADQVSLQFVSSNFFDALGVVPAIGRPFAADEDRLGQEPVVIVSHRFWMRRLGGGEDAPSRNIRINNVPARIIGVAPSGFYGLRPGQWTDVYAPLAARVALLSGGESGPRGEDDTDWWVRQVARLKPGVSDSDAAAEMAGLFRKLISGVGAAVGTQNVPEPVLAPGRRGFGALNVRETNALWILMFLVAVLLLIVCANVANLLLSRAVSRQRESAVRLALGAGRARVLRQHLIESGVFALLGGAAGLGLGYVLAQSMHLLFQAGRDLSNAYDLHLDLRALAYTGALATMTVLLFGLAPALRAAGSDVNGALKVQTRSVIGGRLRLPRLLVSVQIALCLTAIVAAGLLGRTLQNLRWVDIGFDRENLAYASANPRQAGYPPERIGSYANRVREELMKLPGVRAVSMTEVRLLSGNGNASRVNIPGRPFRFQRGVVSAGDLVHLNHVGERFFETLRIPVLAGRTIEGQDIRPGAEAVVVDELFVRRFFPGSNAVGRRFGLGPENNAHYQIVGVVGDSRYNNLRGNAIPTVYMPWIPGDLRGAVHFAIRTDMDSEASIEAVRKAMAAVDPAVPLTEFHTQSGLIDRLLRTERLLAFVSGAFGLVALTLAAIGTGALLAYAVSRRTNEIGVRIAMGARGADVAGMVLRDSLRMLAMGTLLGLPAAWAVARMLRGTLFGLEPLDTGTAALSLLTLLVIAMAAAWVPARRAATVDPMTALRQE
jgi:predicted permease